VQGLSVRVIYEINNGIPVIQKFIQITNKLDPTSQQQLHQHTHTCLASSHSLLDLPDGSAYSKHAKQDKGIRPGMQNTTEIALGFLFNPFPTYKPKFNQSINQSPSRVLGYYLCCWHQDKES